MPTLGLYFLGATIVTHQALIRAKSYTNKVKGFSKEINEKHPTILPPFFASYEDASDINVGCATASLLSSHPMNTTTFELRGVGTYGIRRHAISAFPNRLL